jgi:hypothetical protein
VCLVEYRGSIFKEATNISFGINNFFGHITVLSIEIYRVRIKYRRIFTNTEQKYMMLLQFERGMFAVLYSDTSSKFQSERALNRHKNVTSRKFQDTQTTLGR